MAKGPAQEKPYRILCLDGGGAKGFYTLGVLRGVEAMVKRPLCEHFDLIFGTSTGSIIGTLLAIGKSVDEIHAEYKKHVPSVMALTKRIDRSKKLAELGNAIFEGKKFDAVKTGIGIVTTKWMVETPMIFKADPSQAHGQKDTFVPGFGCSLSDAVQASCSAYPFFDKKVIETSDKRSIVLVDGGYAANNPTLFAIADASRSVKANHSRMRVLSVGVGTYPAPKPKRFTKAWLFSKFEEAEILQKTLEINTATMEQLRKILFPDIRTERISEAFTQPEMTTDMFEHDQAKLDLLRQRGLESFGNFEPRLRELLL